MAAAVASACSPMPASPLRGGAWVPRQLGAIFTPPTLLLELAHASGALQHHELVLGDEALKAVRCHRVSVCGCVLRPAAAAPARTVAVNHTAHVMQDAEEVCALIRASFPSLYSSAVPQPQVCGRHVEGLFFLLLQIASSHDVTALYLCAVAIHGSCNTRGRRCQAHAARCCTYATAATGRRASGGATFHPATCLCLCRCLCFCSWGCIAASWDRCDCPDATLAGCSWYRCRCGPGCHPRIAHPRLNGSADDARTG